MDSMLASGSANQLHYEDSIYLFILPSARKRISTFPKMSNYPFNPRVTDLDRK